MEYTVPFHSEISGDAIPLRYIAEAMARKAASTFGTRKLHGPTLINTRTRYESSLLDAVRKGNLKVCGSDGIVGTVGELVNAAEGIPEKCSDDVKAMLALYVKRQHLNEWAMTNGDVFCLMDVPADVLEFGPERPDGTKEYRGYVGWPFDYFGEHGYLDVELGGIPIELADDDFETDGFVKVASAVTAIAKFLLSKGAPNKFQAERDAWPHILTGVAKGALHPINPDTLQVLSVEYCGNGMVPFSELVTWGRTTKLFAFRRAADAVGNDDDAAEGGGGAVEQFEKQNPNVGAMDQAQAVASVVVTDECKQRTMKKPTAKEREQITINAFLAEVIQRTADQQIAFDPTIAPNRKGFFSAMQEWAKKTGKYKALQSMGTFNEYRKGLVSFLRGQPSNKNTDFYMNLFQEPNNTIQGNEGKIKSPKKLTPDKH